MSTSSTVAFYKGYYAGGKPVVLSANPFDVAQDLSTGNLWQYTGAAWVAPSWQTSITVWLGAAEDVCERLHSEDTKIPDTVHVYIGTDGAVPPELALTADDLAIHHNVGNYNLNVNVLRKDVTTDTFVDVPFPEGYVVTTEDGNWTVLKNFNKCVGYDYATVSLAWTTTADGQGPQSVDYVTSSGARVIAEDVMSSGGGVAPIISGGNGINVITSGGSSTITLADIQEFGEYYSVRANDASVTLDNADIELNAEGRIALNGNNIHLNADDAQINGYAIATEAYVNSAIGQIPIVSGAIISGAEFITQVGDYTLSYTSGGFTVAGSGEDSERNTHIWFNTYDVGLSAGDEAHDAYIKVDTEGDVVIAATGPDRLIEMIGAEGATLNGQQVATQPWVSSAITDLVNVSTVREIANNAAVNIVKSGGTEQELSQITAWFESGYVVYEDVEPETVIGYKPIVLSRVGSDYVRNFTDEVWASASDTQVVLNGSVTCTNISGALVMEADIGQDVCIGGVQEPSQIVAGIIASSTDGGYTWKLSQSGTYAGLSWCAYDYETYAQGDGVCTSVTALRAPGAVVSGALVSNTQFATTVGGYRLTYTASGGLVVSGGGVALQVSSGGIVANGSGGSVALIGGAVSAGGKGGGYLMLGDPEDIPTASVGVGGGAGIEFDADDIVVHGSYITITCKDVTVNSRPVATQLVTSTIADTGVWVQVLSGGTSIVCTSPLEGISVDSVAKSTEASYIHFTLDSVTLPTPVVVSGVSYLNSATFEGGKEYLVGFFDGMVVVNEVTSGGVLQ